MYRAHDALCFGAMAVVLRRKRTAERRRIAEDVIATFASCPVLEIASLGRT